MCETVVLSKSIQDMKKILKNVISCVFPTWCGSLFFNIVGKFCFNGLRKLISEIA